MPDSMYAFIDRYDQAPKSEWFHRCRQAEKPYVVIRPQPDSADVLWDYVTLPPWCDRVLAEHLPELEKQAFAIFDEYATERSGFRVTPTLISFTGLPCETAELAAADLYHLIDSVLHAPQAALPSYHEGLGASAH